QMRSDVPLGAHLSGGIDSAAATAIAARERPGLDTFTCGFTLPQHASERERGFDERPHARALARLLGTRHHEIQLGPDALAASLPALVWHLEEPRLGISYPNFYTAELASRHVKVVMAGVGADELFAGYPWRYRDLGPSAASDTTRLHYRRWAR